MNFSISPKVSMYWSIGVAVLSAIVGGLVIPDYVPAGIAHNIVQTAAAVLTLSAGINGVLHGYSAPVAGPLVTK